jgi:hypothetical protein
LVRSGSTAGGWTCCVVQNENVYEPGWLQSNSKCSGTWAGTLTASATMPEATLSAVPAAPSLASRPAVGPLPAPWFRGLPVS